MIAKFSVKKPLTVFVSVIMVIVLGFISFTSMTTDLLPKIDLPYVVVTATYPGASPEKIEETVTKPLEKVLSTTSGVENINSVSSENASMIYIEFSQGMNMDSAMIDLSSKIDMAKSMLDSEVTQPTIMKVNPDMIPIMVASVDVNNQDIKATSKTVKDDIIPRFERIEGIASVSGTGLIEESIKVTLDQKKIDNLDKKVLGSIDSKLTEAKGKIEDGQAKIKQGKDKLENQSKSKTQEIVNVGIALQEGKNQLQTAVNNLPKAEAELQSKKAELVKSKEALETVIKIQEESGVPVLKEQRDALNEMAAGIDAIDKNILNIKNQKPELQKKLEEIRETEKKVESGKLTLNQELSKASATLSSSEAELAKASKEFEAGREEAYKKANVKDMLNKDAISKILTAQNFSMPAGYIKEGESEYLVKVGDKIKSLDELKKMVLLKMDVNGVGEVHVEDVATVEKYNNSGEMYAKINGNDGILLSFQKQSNVSTSEVSKKINDEIKKITSENKNLHITSLQDQGVYINVVIESVLSNLILGGILSIIILLVFLRSIKPTIVIAFSIPISVLFAMTMMYFSGVTINIISLSGLALGVGMLVDNSIVVIENIHRLKDEGLSPAKAAVKGATEVAGAITASTLTTICVFLPIVFTKGLSRQLFTDMGLTIAYSLIASLIVALTLVPSMSSKMSRDKARQHRLFERFVNFYEMVLRKSLKHRAIVLICVGVLFIGSAVLSISKGAVLMPESDGNQISVTLNVPKGTDRKEAREMSTKVIDRLSKINEIETVGALQAGTGGMSLGGEGNDISYYILLKEDRKLTSQEVGSLITKKTSDLGYDIKVESSSMDMSALGGSGIEVVIKGNDLDKIKNIGKDVGNIIKNTKGTYDISNGLDEASMETRITIDKAKAMEYGLTTAQVYQAVSEGIKNKLESTILSIGDNEYPVIIVNNDKDSLTRESLKNYMVTGNKNGEEVKVKLSDIASIKEEESLASIKHENGARSLTVTALVDSDHNIALVSNEVDTKLKSYKLDEGYTIEIGGEKEAMESAFSDLVKMITLAVLFIYLIMVAQFQSFLSPFIVIFTIPLAFTGGFLALLLTGFEVSMIAILGFLMLSGIVVNNGIVFVDYVNQLRLGGMEKREALVTAGKVRIRPILMTAITTILGLSTLAIGMGTGADMIQPMAIVTIGGLTYATILTLIIVPIVYDLLNRKAIKNIEIED